MIAFAAVLLAGGQSRRMGRDKALLPLTDGRLLWQRQLAVLRGLGPAELFISGPAREDFPPEVPLLADRTPGLGPLSGIAAALAAMRSPRLVALAVDLPKMTADFLRSLLSEGASHGVLPQARPEFFEPLAAVYPRTAFPLAERLLSGDDRSLQSFARLLVENGHAVAHPLTEIETLLFANWNGPDDLTAPTGVLNETASGA